MQLGVIGLGRRGPHIVRRMLAGPHQCVVLDDSPRAIADVACDRVYAAASIPDFVRALDAPRAIWIAEPAEAVDITIDGLRSHLQPADIILVCADSHYGDDIYRAESLAALRIHYIDVGVCGPLGHHGQGCSLALGGDAAVVRYLAPVFELVSAPCDRAARNSRTTGYLHCGPAGAGRFVSMVHNGIERCLSAAYAEGFSILRAANAGRKGRGTGAAHRMIHPEHFQYDFDLAAIGDLWKHGSRVSSPVLHTMLRAMAGTRPNLPLARERAPGEDWAAVRAATEEGISTPVLTSAVYVASRGAADSQGAVA